MRDTVAASCLTKCKLQPLFPFSPSSFLNRRQFPFFIYERHLQITVTWNGIKSVVIILFCTFSCSNDNTRACDCAVLTCSESLLCSNIVLLCSTNLKNNPHHHHHHHHHQSLLTSIPWLPSTSSIVLRWSAPQFCSCLWSADLWIENKNYYVY